MEQDDCDVLPPSWSAAIADVVALAPPLTDAQRADLRALLRPHPHRPGDREAA